MDLLTYAVSKYLATGNDLWQYIHEKKDLPKALVEDAFSDVIQTYQDEQAEQLTYEPDIYVTKHIPVTFQPDGKDITVSGYIDDRAMNVLSKKHGLDKEEVVTKTIQSITHTINPNREAKILDIQFQLDAFKQSVARTHHQLQQLDVLDEESAVHTVNVREMEDVRDMKERERTDVREEHEAKHKELREELREEHEAKHEEVKRVQEEPVQAEPTRVEPVQKDVQKTSMQKPIQDIQKEVQKAIQNTKATIIEHPTSAIEGVTSPNDVVIEYTQSKPSISAEDIVLADPPVEEVPVNALTHLSEDVTKAYAKDMQYNHELDELIDTSDETQPHEEELSEHETRVVNGVLVSVWNDFMHRLEESQLTKDFDSLHDLPLALA